MSDLALQPILVLLSESAAGNPSQYMVEKAFLHHELDWRYLTVEVAEDALEDAVRGIRALGFAGGNCARPHRSRIAPYLDRLGKTAELSGVVNLLRRGEEGLVGENTLGKGLIQTLQTKRETPSKHVLLFGSGDLGTAAALELAESGVEEITIVSRNEEHASRLAQLLGAHDDISVRSLPWDTAEEASGEIDLVINATPVGTEAVEGLPPIPWPSLSPATIVVDANLEEIVPPLLHAAAERELTTINGLDLFLEQAAVNFQLWTGIDPNRTVMRESVEEYLEL